MFVAFESLPFTINRARGLLRHAEAADQLNVCDKELILFRLEGFW